MLLTIHNLPSNSKYGELKALITTECGIKKVILDNLMSEGTSKKVTVGVAEEEDAAILIRKINGFYWNGQQLYVNDEREKKDIYRPTNVSNISSSNYQNTSTRQQSTPSMDIYRPTNVSNMSSSNYQNTSTRQQSTPNMVPSPMNNMPGSSSYFTPGQNSTYSGFGGQQPLSTMLAQQTAQGMGQGPTIPTQRYFNENNPPMWSKNTNYQNTPRPDQTYSSYYNRTGSMGNNESMGSDRRDDQNNTGFGQGARGNDQRMNRETSTIPIWDNRNYVSGQQQLNQQQQGTSQPNRNTSFGANPPAEQRRSGQPSSSNTYQRLKDMERGQRPYFEVASRSSSAYDRSVARDQRDQPRPTSLSSVSRDNRRDYQDASRFQDSAPPTGDVWRSTGESSNQGQNYNKYGKKKKSKKSKSNASQNKMMSNPDPITDMVKNPTNWMEFGVHRIVKSILRNVNVKFDPTNNVCRLLTMRVTQSVKALIKGRGVVKPKEIYNMYRNQFNEKDDKNFFEQIGKRHPNQPGEFIPKMEQAFAPNAINETGGPSWRQFDSKPIKMEQPQPPATPMIPHYPQGDKKQFKKDKLEMKKEFLEGTAAQKLNPVDRSALEKEVQPLVEIFFNRFANADLPEDKLMCSARDALTDQFRKIMEWNITKRLLNVGSKALRVFGTPKVPKRAELANFLLHYGVVSLKKSEKQRYYIVNVDNYENQNKLCAMSPVAIGDVMVTFKPMQIAGPPFKLSKAESGKMHRAYLARQNELAENDFPEDEVKIEGDGDDVEMGDDETDELNMGILEPTEQANEDAEDVEETGENEMERTLEIDEVRGDEANLVIDMDAVKAEEPAEESYDINIDDINDDDLVDY